ncbi:MAG: pentapeptide repeat-containing protein [Anaerotignaceae bacterium]
MGIKGYKVFNPDWTCRGFQYEVGKEFVHNGNIEMCGKGFHFCQKASDCFEYYGFDSNNKVAEVEATGLVETNGNKSVTDKLLIVKELSWYEVLDIVNIGKDCTGLCNTGDCNTGDRNTGDCNTGDCNTGNRNTGDCNTGDCNTGDRNTGNRNTGDCNTGNRNTGNRNTGDWNSCNFSTGFLNSVTQPIPLFNKPTDLTRQDIFDTKGISVLNWNFESCWWIYSDNMTDEEKQLHPEHETTGGYLKTVDFKTACKMMWDNLDDDDKRLVKDIPNFDSKVFKEITGIITG